MTEFMYRDSELQMDSNLVLYIEEHDNRNDFTSVDNKIFIIWDKETQMFHLRGKRQNIQDKDFAPYALKYNIWDNLYNFVNFAIGSNETTSVALYNFNNIKRLKLDDLTYEYLESLVDKNYEIAWYDKIQLRKKNFMKYLYILME
jgi:hypothetical protein